MSRPKTKDELLYQAQTNFDQLMSLIQGLDKKTRESTFEFKGMQNLKGAHWERDENISDVLTHLYAWHQLLTNWVMKNTRAIKTPFIPKPYTFKTYGALNIEFNKKYKDTHLDEAIKMIKMSHLEAMHIIKSLTNEMLFTPKYFTWTGTTSLGSYCVSATSSHYDWAYKKIKKHLKMLQNKSTN
jgi:hypothetical protein